VITIPSEFPSNYSPEDKVNFLQTIWMQLSGLYAQMLKEASEAITKQSETVSGLASTLKYQEYFLS
jgi:hypothetical protein